MKTVWPWPVPRSMSLLMRAVARSAVATAAAVLVIYAADLIWIRIRMANNGDATGEVQVQVTYAIPHKNGRIEYDLGGVQTERCVHALFPQLGLRPCWYVERHRAREIRY